MSRFAVLIEASAVPGETPLPGAVIDVANLKGWLMSNAGGAWEESEIAELHNPTPKLVRDYVAYTRTQDFAFVSFAGHGGQPHGSDYDETELSLNGGNVLARELNGGAARCSVLIDACRWRAPEIFTEPFLKAQEMIKNARATGRDEHRAMFDRAVEYAEKGVVYLFSCDTGEFAGDSRITGGYYTRFLIEEARDWYRNHSKSGHYATTHNAHEWAAASVTARAAQQHPQYYPGRRRVHLPFSVRP